jgi:hypothetical protein
MTVTEKVAYIRGLAEGLELDENKKEVKVINAIIDLLEDLSESITDTEDVVTDVEGQLDEVDEDLGNLERFVYGDNESEADDGCGCSCDNGDEDDYYEVTCPNCHETICLSQDIVEDGQMECPNCGEVLEFDLEDDDENSDEDDSAEEDKD